MLRHAHRTLSWLVSLTALLAACTSAAPEAGRASQPSGTTGASNVLRISTLGSPPKLFHPYPETQLLTSPHSDAWTLMGAGLISVNYDTLDYWADPRQDMARELPTVSNGGRTFTFTLRDDLKWSDGQPITTDDFAYAYENAIKPENDFVGLDDLERIEMFRTPDARTIEVTLKLPYARFLALGIAAIGPVPKHTWQGRPWLDPQGNPELLKPTVVPGPYMLREVSAERHIYTRNPNWWGKKANIDEVVFESASPQTALELLRTRQVEWAQNFPPSQYGDAKKIPNANIIEWAGATGTYRVVIFNLKRPTLSDKRVREALARTINRADLIQFEDDLAVPQYGFYTDGNTKWVNSSVQHYDYDLNRARQLLQEAGMRMEGSSLRDRNGQPVTLEIIWPTTSQPRGKMATYLQQQWKQLGIDVTVTGLEFGAFVDKYARQKDYDVSMGTYGGGSFDPDTIKTQIKTDGTQNSNGYTNPRVDELLEQGAVEQDDARRKQIYDEIQKLVVDDLPMYFMVTTKNFTAFDKKVGGIVPLKGGDLLGQNNMQILDWYVAQ